MIRRPSHLSNRPISGTFLGEEDWTLISRTTERQAGRTVLGPEVPRPIAGVSDIAANIKLPETGAYVGAELVLYVELGTLDATPARHARAFP